MRTNTSASSGKARWTGRAGRWLVVAGTILLLTAVFFIARHAGTEAGQQAARDRIAQENNLTAGPESLIRESR